MANITNSMHSGPLFCPHCGNLLDFPAVSDWVDCELCGFRQACADFENIETVTCIKNLSSENIGVVTLQESSSLGDEASATIKEKCPKCGNVEMSFKAVQLRSVDEGQTIFYTCTKCRMLPLVFEGYLLNSGQLTEVMTALKNEEVQLMVAACLQAKKNSYSPYSHFPVGAALMAEDGTIITGCNVENASYGLTICAERVAIASAVSKGMRRFKAIAICCDRDNEWLMPCGACLQVIAEFKTIQYIYTVQPDGTYKCVTLKDLLPHAFAL